jgi:pimeloyl-ACP methyl ester carboxylesterase
LWITDGCVHIDFTIQWKCSHICIKIKKTLFKNNLQNISFMKTIKIKTQIKSCPAHRVKKIIKRNKEQFDWGKIDLIDIIPEKKTQKLPILFAPGWSITINTIQDTLTYLVDCGYRVLSLNHKRVGGVKHRSEEDRKATSILAILNRKEIEQVDAVGYSEGCTNVLLAAQMQPEKFRHIVLMTPSGLTSPESVMRLSKGFLVDLWDIRNKKDKRTKRCRIVWETVKYILANPIRSYKEVNEVANTDLIKLLKELNKTHIKVSIIHNIEDKTFDFDAVQETLQKAGADIYINEFYAVSGRHFGLIKFPRKYMDYVAYALEHFDKLDNKTTYYCKHCKK